MKANSTAIKGKQQLQKKHLENEFLKIAEQKCGPQEVQRLITVQSPKDTVIIPQMGGVNSISNMARGHNLQKKKQWGQKPAPGRATSIAILQTNEKLETSKKCCQIRKMNNF